MEQGAPGEVLGGSPQNLLLMAQDGAASAQEAVIRVGAWGIDPLCGHASLRQESNDALSQASVGTDVVVSDAGVGAGKDDRPGQVTGCVQ